VQFLREPDAGFAWTAYRWASGHRLEAVLADADLAAGDFVRRIRQLVDLLGQVADAAAAQGTPAGRQLAKSAKEAVRSLQRGVVDFSSL
jgi:ATP-dependent RNA helicase HelY